LKFGAPMEARHHVLVLRAGSRVNVNNSDETKAFCQGADWILNGEFDPGSGRTLAARLTHASRTLFIPSGVEGVANGCVTREQPAWIRGITEGNLG
jgi:hypothetical protein